MSGIFQDKPVLYFHYRIYHFYKLNIKFQYSFRSSLNFTDAFITPIFSSSFVTFITCHSIVTGHHLHTEVYYNIHWLFFRIISYKCSFRFKRSFTIFKYQSAIFCFTSEVRESLNKR